MGYYLSMPDIGGHMGTFNLNLNEGYAPDESSISCGGEIRKHYFKFEKNTTTEFAEPVYSIWRTQDPITNS